MPMRKPLTVLVAVLLAACSEASGPTEISVAGSWRFTFSGLGSAPQFPPTVTCSVTAADFTLTQSGSTFSGIQIGTARATCTQSGQVVVDVSIENETIVNGQISEASVTFRLGSIPGQHTGAVSGTSITGTAQWILDAGLTLNGQFTAAKLN
jgi:hypothetical protein